NGFEYLRYNHHEVIVFQVTHNRTEKNFELENRPYKIIDMETGEVLKLSPTEIRSYFQRLAAEHQEQLKRRFLQYKIDYIEADIERPFDQVLSPWLMKRSRMY
ncbi:MAG TPA: DUF58 domain-containing protein, partial [Salinivirgaceae bacterium]|nr:DUF58 domain-containing protein [Salinivirgaceae bacterium]